jgi:hypothetical protein
MRNIYTDPRRFLRINKSAGIEGDRVKTKDWRLEIGDWRLETGDWEQEIRNSNWKE